MTELLSTMDEKAATFMDLLEAGQFSIAAIAANSSNINEKQAVEPEMTAHT